MNVQKGTILLQVCLERKFNVFQCDCLELPIHDGAVKACISIAVIHLIYDFWKKQEVFLFASKSEKRL